MSAHSESGEKATTLQPCISMSIGNVFVVTKEAMLIMSSRKCQQFNIQKAFLFLFCRYPILAVAVWLSDLAQ